MGFKHRATVAASIGFAVCAIAGCGSSGTLLSASQASALSDQLQRVSEAVAAGDCTTAENDLTSFEDRVSSLSGVNSTLVNNLSQGANTIQTLTQDKCSDQTVTTKTKPTNTTTVSTTPQTNTDTVTTATNTDTVDTNTYTTQTYTAPDTYTETSTTGGSGLSTPTETDTTSTATTPTTITTTSTAVTDPTGGAGDGDSSTTVASATSYYNTEQIVHRHHRWGGGF